MHIEDGFSGFCELNLARINEADNYQYYNNCFLSSLSISFQYSFLSLESLTNYNENKKSLPTIYDSFLATYPYQKWKDFTLDMIKKFNLIILCITKAKLGYVSDINNKFIIIYFRFNKV